MLLQGCCYGLLDLCVGLRGYYRVPHVWNVSLISGEMLFHEVVLLGFEMLFPLYAVVLPPCALLSSLCTL
jgi:hypothetical protein